MSWRQIFCALRSGRLTVTFLVLETVLACAFICNALFFIAHQAGPMLAPTGVAPGQVLVVNRIFTRVRIDPKTHAMSGGFSKADLQTLETRVRTMPGVVAVSLDLGNGVPYSGNADVPAAYRTRDRATPVHASTYSGDNLIRAFGLTLTKGRHFSATEIAMRQMTEKGGSGPDAAIITQALAQELFPDGHALGHRLYTDASGTVPGPVVVGIVRHMPGYQPVIAAHPDVSVFLPRIYWGTPAVGMVVRVKASARARVAKALPGVISDSVPLGMFARPHVHTFESLHDDYFRPNRGKTWSMLAVTLAVLVINVICIAGLTGFWVQRRTRHIGIRRALGATRGTILRYFLAENLVVIGVGVILGVIAAYAGNVWLMSQVELAPLPWWWLPVGGVLLCVLGQLSALAPAFRAARVPPAVATRGLGRLRAT